MCSSNESNLMPLTRSDQGWRNENWPNIRAISSWIKRQILLSSLTRKPTGRHEGLVIDAKNVLSVLRGLQTLSFQPFFISSPMPFSIFVNDLSSIQLGLRLMAWRGLLHTTESFRFPIPPSLEGRVNSLCVLGVNECEERFFFLYVFYTLCSWLLEVPQ